MKTIIIPGLSGKGPGDWVAGLSAILQQQFTDNLHLKIYTKIEGNYKSIVEFLIEQFDLSEFQPFDLTYEIIQGNHRKFSQNPCRTVEEAHSKFDSKTYKKDWDLIGYKDTEIGYGKYINFKRQWKGKKNGPILLVLNTDEVNRDYHYPQKWFDEITNSRLNTLVDNRNVIKLTNELRSFDDNIQLMQECRYIVGLDSRWTHISNCMNVPYFVSKNNWTTVDLMIRYFGHPCMKIITKKETYNYLDEKKYFDVNNLVGNVQSPNQKISFK